MELTTYSTYTDEQLLAALKKDDSQAFGSIYSRYYPDVHRYLLVLVKVPELAEDLTHEVFIRIWESRQTINITRSFKSYLLRSAHNKAIDFIRKNAAEARFLDQLLHHYKTTAPDENFTPADHQRLDVLVEEALASLTPKRRQVYELSRKEKKSYAEIAQELNISINTVKVHISETLALLREFILDKGEITLVLLLLIRY